MRHSEPNVSARQLVQQCSVWIRGGLFFFPHLLPSTKSLSSMKGM